MQTLTDGEQNVIRAFKSDCFVADHGWQSKDASTWVDACDAKTCGMTGLQFAGTMSSLVQKGVCWTNGEAWGLTDEGREVAGII